MFAILIAIALTIKKYCKAFPRIWYTVICRIGVYTIFDPIFVLINDVIIYQDFENGDWFRLYNYY